MSVCVCVCLLSSVSPRDRVRACIAVRMRMCVLPLCDVMSPRRLSATSDLAAGEGRGGRAQRESRRPDRQRHAHASTTSGADRTLQHTGSQCNTVRGEARRGEARRLAVARLASLLCPLAAALLSVWRHPRSTIGVQQRMNSEGTSHPQSVRDRSATRRPAARLDWLTASSGQTHSPWSTPFDPMSIRSLALSASPRTDTQNEARVCAHALILDLWAADVSLSHCRRRPLPACLLSLLSSPIIHRTQHISVFRRCNSSQLNHSHSRPSIWCSSLVPSPHLSSSRSHSRRRIVQFDLRCPLPPSCTPVLANLPARPLQAALAAPLRRVRAPSSRAPNTNWCSSAMRQSAKPASSRGSCTTRSITPTRSDIHTGYSWRIHIRCMGRS